MTIRKAPIQFQLNFISMVVFTLGCKILNFLAKNACVKA